jgi:hypothetical protein
MANGYLAPSPILQPLDDNGNVVAAGKLYFYAPGTETTRSPYTNLGLSVAHAQPVVLDAAGRAVIYLDATSYDVVFKTAAGVTIWGPVTVPSTSLVQSGLGELFAFGGDSNSPVVATSYPSGTGGDTLHAGTRTISLDSATLASGGTFKLSAMLKGEGGGTATLALVNLTDGSPDTAMVEISSSSTTGALLESGAITFPAGGATKSYGLKLKTSAGAAYAWGGAVARTA